MTRCHAQICESFYGKTLARYDCTAIATSGFSPLSSSGGAGVGERRLGRGAISNIKPWRHETGEDWTLEKHEAEGSGEN